VSSNAFILLLQMTVLPYVVTSLIAGLGRLDMREARTLAVRAGGLLLALWALGLVLVLMLPLAFPAWEAASFFSTALVAERASMDFLQLYIPANPFRSLSETVVPAIVVFSIAFGVALIGIPEKRRLVDALDTMADALMRITQFVVRLAPLGVFAIAAKAAGTLDVDEFGRLQVFVLAHASLALLLAFWLLPGLVAALTPLRHREVLAGTRTALVTAFATGNVLIVLPMLADQTKHLLESAGLSGEGETSSADILVPASFNFPSVGKLLSLGFVPFAGWFVGATLSAGEYPSLAFAGLFSFFGHVVVALPFLLDLFHLPADGFELFLAVDVVTGRFGSMVAAMHIATIALVGTFAMAGGLRLQWARLIRFVAIGLGVALAALLAIRVFFTYVVGHEYKAYRAFIGMELSTELAPAKVFEDGPPPGQRLRAESALERIRQRGAVRVCYMRDDLPFAFVNRAGHLVGFDVELAHVLARELEIGVEFVRIDFGNPREPLERGDCDLVSSLPVTTTRARELDFSRTYIDQTIAFVVPDHRRNDFNSRNAVQSLESPRIAIPNVPYYMDKIREYLPTAELVIVASPRDYFQRSDEFDALVFSAEGGSAWSLVHPEYAVAIPRPDIWAIPTGFALAKGDAEWRNFLNTWIELKQKDGTIDRIYDHWIQGEAAETKAPRWSVIRDVLGWIQ
jgi:Na+/H+-dicarboxylate symporter/ABC-type amino acid transport substrate-binding protein